MVLSTRFEANTLMGPAHRPIDTPKKFEITTVTQIFIGSMPTMPAVSMNDIATIPREIEFIASACIAKASDR